jgi:hypothetical protein
MACLLFPCSLSHSIGREEHALSPPENRREICSRILYFADACSFDYTFSIGNAKERDQPQPPKNTLQSQYMLPSVVDSIHSIAWQATSTPWDGMPFGDMASRRANFQSHDPAHARSITKPEKGYTCPFSLEKLRIGWFTLLLSQVTISVCLAPRETYAAMCPYAPLQSPPPFHSRSGDSVNTRISTRPACSFGSTARWSIRQTTKIYCRGIPMVFR